MAKCLQPLRIINPHYKKLAEEHSFKSNSVYDFASADDFYIEVPCGLCINCLSSKRSEWRIRLLSEYKYLSQKDKDNTLYMTYTFSEDYVEDAENNPAKYIRKFCENYRRYFGVSPRRFFVTEYGEKTGRFHMHGFIFGSLTNKKSLLQALWSDNPPPRPTQSNIRKGLLRQYWQRSEIPTFGFLKFTRLGNIPINSKSHPLRTVNYIACYITKYLKKLVIEKDEKQKVFVSPGLGLSYCTDPLNIVHHTSMSGDNFTFNTAVRGFVYPYQIPRYFKLKIFSPFKLKLIKEYYKTLNDDLKFKPPFRIGSYCYNDVYSFARIMRDNGLKCDLDRQYQYYLYNKKFD